MANALRRARERIPLTQAGLAARAGVTRQVIGAAEAGRHVPSVDAALRIARALGATVEDLFGHPADVVPADGLADGTPVVVARVGDRPVAHALAGLVAGDGAWAAPDGVADGGTVRLVPGAAPEGLVVVGCDPILGLCAALIGAHGPRRLVAVPGTTGTAIAALAEGRAHAGLVHGPESRLPAAPAGVRRIHLTRWEVGVGVHPDHDRGALEPLLRGDVPFIQREDSAASQQALARAAGDRLPAAAARAAGHVDAARRAALTGGAAVTFAPAARHHGLGFIPLETHVVEIWIDERHTAHPGADALLGLLGTDAFRARAGLIGGYDLEAVGREASA
ncbi:helix-turn-helix domain-containing protein [Miltoncostaea oceani]|uniref:helix-turn-helix domain-containing protein n=1 Tax=Miltoncostaea oceani TaxID=2843216 RepID=UPI001C3C6E78|nr:helix-turn-helix domain-containing protein [Miltoncostaea oceani]